VRSVDGQLSWQGGFDLFGTLHAGELVAIFQPSMSGSPNRVRATHAPTGGLRTSPAGPTPRDLQRPSAARPIAARILHLTK